MNDQRKFERLGVSFPVECKSLPDRKYFYTVSKDLSLGGLKILTNDFLPKNNLIKLNINLIDKVLNVKAKVAWCNSERASERYTAGLEFVEINNTNQKELTNFINTIYNS